MIQKILLFSALLAISISSFAQDNAKREVIIIEEEANATTTNSRDNLEITDRSSISDTTTNSREVIIIEEGNGKHYGYNIGGSDSYNGYDFFKNEFSVLSAPKQKGKKAYFGVFGSRWMGISFGYTALIPSMGNWNKPSELSFMRQEPNSPNFNLNLIGLEIISTKVFALTTGLGFEFNSFRFREEMILRPSGEMVLPYDMSDRDVRYIKKSKLATSYLNIPLLAEFRFGGHGSINRGMYIYGGVVGGWGYNIHSKAKYTDANTRTQRDKYRDFNINNLRWGYTAGIGISRFGLYMMYYPQPVFGSPNRELRQVSVGISINTGRVRSTL